MTELVFQCNRELFLESAVEGNRIGSLEGHGEELPESGGVFGEGDIRHDSLLLADVVDEDFYGLRVAAGALKGEREKVKVEGVEVVLLFAVFAVFRVKGSVEVVFGRGRTEVLLKGQVTTRSACVARWV